MVGESCLKWVLGEKGRGCERFRASVLSGSMDAMASRPDITLYDQKGRLLLVVEVKHKRETTPEWAAALRRNLLAHEGFRQTEYFLVLTPDHLYLWKGLKAEAAAVLPDFVAE